MLTIRAALQDRWVEHTATGSKYKLKPSSGLFKLTLSEQVHLGGMKVEFDKKAISFCLSEVLLDWTGVEDAEGNEIKFISPEYALIILPDTVLSFLVSEIYKHTFYYDADLEKKS